jgi:PAS domain S-box-containing protein
MPKKKQKIDKRINTLFDGVKPEDATSSSKQGQSKGSREAGRQAIDSKLAAPVNTVPRPRLATTGMLTQRIESIVVDNGNEMGIPASMSLGFQMDQTNWATMHVVDDEHTRTWSSDDQLLIKQVTDQLSLALENARLFQETQKRAEELTAINRIVTGASQFLNLQQLLDQLLQQTLDIMGMSGGLVSLVNETSGKLALFSHQNLPEPILQKILSQGLDGTPCDYVYRTKSVLAVKDLREGAPVDASGLIANNILSYLGVPLTHKGDTLGTLCLFNTTPKSMEARTIDLARTIGIQIGFALENASLFQKVSSSEAQLTEALRIARLANWEYDFITDTFTFNDQFYNVMHTNAKREGGYAMSSSDYAKRFFHPEDVAVVEAEIINAIRTEDPGFSVNIEHRTLLRDGGVGYILMQFRIQKDEQGRTVKAFGANQDITERKTSELIQTATAQITEAALSATRLEDLLHTVHEAVRRITPADNFYIALYNPEQGLVTFPYFVDEVDPPPPPMEYGLGLTSYVIRVGSPLLVTPEMDAELQNSGLITPDGAPSVDWLGIPLRSASGVRGVMTIQSYNPQIRLTQVHLQSLVPLAAQVTAALERFEARDALAKSEADLRALFSSMEDVVLVVDGDGRYIRIAPTNPSRLVRPPEELLGQLMRDVLPKETADRFVKGIQQTLKTGETSQLEYDLPVGNETFWFLASLSKLNENEVFWVARDITERKKAEEGLMRRNTYLAASADISRLITSTLDLNTLFNRTVSLVRERFGFYHAAIFIVEETGFIAHLQEATGDAGAAMKIQKHSLQVGSSSIVGEVTQTGKAVIVNDTASSPIHKVNPLLPDTRAEAGIPLRIGSRTIGALDIQSTQINAFSEDDIAVLQTLSDQVAIAIDNARSYELSLQAVKEMREIDRLKTTFLANMSHELRTPLNSIIGFSRVILKGIDGPITDLQQSDLSAIYNSGQHLLGLINDILDVSKIEAGKMELAFEEVNLSDVISSVMSTAMGLIKDKPIRLVKNVPADLPHAHADPIRIRQVLINLFSNAAKFTDEGEITVEAHVQTNATGQSELYVGVTDSGPGIAEKDHGKLFQPFSQVDDAPTRKTGGSGLGLSISQRLIHMHGGQIGLNSSAGHGSTFYFTVPIHREHKSSNPEGRLVLAIDDDPQVISLYERYLKSAGYEVIALSDPSQAVKRVAELKPFAVTLDIMMPGVDGWQVLTELKSNPETRDVPVMICSIIEEQERGFSLGAADYLVKPILEEDLVHALNRLNADGKIHDVLVIDDNPNDLSLMGKMLTDNGRYHPMLAQGGEKGWEMILNNPPQAVIIDLFMPKMDGFKILEKMRTNKGLSDIPVIVVSGGDLTPDQRKQLDEYGQQLISKSSLSEQDLIASLERALQRIKTGSG